jgi:glucose-6-phosphate isomerase
MNEATASISVVIPADLAARVSSMVETLIGGRFASRLAAKDTSLWGEGAEAEASVRLNWTNAVFQADELVAQAQRLRKEFSIGKNADVLLCGMGGSSLGPQLLSDLCGGSLRVLDTTHPGVVSRMLDDIEDTIFVISSKSGTTLETRCHLAAVEDRLRSMGILPSSRILVITDPDSELAHYAWKEEYRTVLADPNVGGRYSIFTAYGIIPAVLAGASVGDLLDEAKSATSTLFQDRPENPALSLASLAVCRADQMILANHERPASFDAWIEQLVAESTGKDGKAVLPAIQLGHSNSSQATSQIQMSGSVGGQLLTWQVATTAMAWLLNVNPFDQPDVELAKKATRAQLAMGSSHSEPRIVSTFSQVLNEVNDSVKPNSYVAFQIFDETQEAQTLEALQNAASEHFQLPVTVNIGPRYLHSSGQLHKGGPKRGIFIQLVAHIAQDSSVPGQGYTFGQIIRAQADGDAAAIRETGQTVVQCGLSVSTFTDELRNLI